MSDATTILLIDGNHKDREYCAQRLQLSSPDYDVVQATTGQSGLDLCARQPIDCVILEIDLPDMSGFEVLAVSSTCLSSRDRRYLPYTPTQSILVRTRSKKRRTSRLSKDHGQRGPLQYGHPQVHCESAKE
jgi:CheY-like chemotaxis protein